MHADVQALLVQCADSSGNPLLFVNAVRNSHMRDPTLGVWLRHPSDDGGRSTDQRLGNAWEAAYAHHVCRSRYTQALHQAATAASLNKVPDTERALVAQSSVRMLMKVPEVVASGFSDGIHLVDHTFKIFKERLSLLSPHHSGARCDAAGAPGKEAKDPYSTTAPVAGGYGQMHIHEGSGDAAGGDGGGAAVRPAGMTHVRWPGLGITGRACRVLSEMWILLRKF